MSGFSWWSLSAFAVGIILVGIDFKMTAAQRKKAGSYLLLIGIPLLVAGILGMGYDGYVRWIRSRPVALIQPALPPPHVEPVQKSVDKKETESTKKGQGTSSNHKSAPPPVSAPVQQSQVQINNAPNGVGSLGAITTGPCSNVQVGGISNEAQTNCGPIERHVTDTQKAELLSALTGKHVNVVFGAVLNAPDAQQFAFELCSVFKEAGVVTDCPIMPMMQTGTPTLGISFEFKGPEGKAGEIVSIPENSPAGIVVSAFVAAHINRGSAHPHPDMEEGLVKVIVGPPPSP